MNKLICFFKGHQYHQDGDRLRIITVCHRCGRFAEPVTTIWDIINHK